MHKFHCGIKHASVGSVSTYFAKYFRQDLIESRSPQEQSRLTSQSVKASFSNKDQNNLFYVVMSNLYCRALQNVNIKSKIKAISLQWCGFQLCVIRNYITLTNQSGRKQRNEPIKIRNYHL